jgi:hypothetical protein
MQHLAMIVRSAWVAALMLTAFVTAAHGMAGRKKDHSKVAWVSRLSAKVTMEVSSHSRTLSKVSGELVDYLTRVIVGHPCVDGEGWALNGSEVVEGMTAPQPSRGIYVTTVSQVSYGK